MSINTVSNEAFFYPIADLPTDSCILGSTQWGTGVWVAHDLIDPKTKEKTQHVFHKECLKRWIWNDGLEPKCPKCSKKIVPSTVVTAEELQPLIKNETLREGCDFLVNVCAVACVALPALAIVFLQ